jgi:hypothetical protein
MTKRDEAFADLPTIALVKGNADFNALLSPPEGYDGPCWTAHFIGPDQNKVAAEIKRRWDSFEAMRKALEGLTAMYVAMVNSGDCGFWNPEEEAEVIAARAALRLAEEGERG